MDEPLAFESPPTEGDLLFVLFKALPLSRSQLYSDLRNYCLSNKFSLSRSFDDTLRLLEFVSIVRVDDNVVSVNESLFSPSEFKDPSTYLEKSSFVASLLRVLKAKGILAELVVPDAVRRDSSSGFFYVLESLIPLRLISIRNILISMGFFARDPSFGVGYLLVNPKWTALFESEVVNPFREHARHPSPRLSLRDLKAGLDEREAAGREAERFVVNYELKRLSGHPEPSSIRRISDEWANAGFDIESFDSNDSVLVDRFIEVKSFSSTPVFYWSRNEVDAAREFGDHYFLYIVDRNRIGEPGYRPKILQDPGEKVFEERLWGSEVEVWKIVPTMS